MPKYNYCLDSVVKESRAPMKLEDVTNILKCLCHALQYMHKNDYVHADVKAANIMMNQKHNYSEVFLIDFGLARKVGKVVDKEDKKKGILRVVYLCLLYVIVFSSRWYRYLYIN